MMSIIFLCPYFGRIDLGIHTVWLQGCAANPSIKFLFITDDRNALNVEMPDNVECIFMEWDDCIRLIKSKIDFDVVINSPYKLCDFRPAFGHIFEEYIEGYDFWGHTDSGDTLYGDLRGFLTNDMLRHYDKIHMFGHLSIYKNEEKINKCYLIPGNTGPTIQDIFSVGETVGFDDMYQKASINRLFQENGFSLLERVPDLVADVLPSKWAFCLWEDKGERKKRIFEWDRGKLYDVTVKECTIQRREVGYLHLQKRKMSNELIAEAKHFYIIPNRFIMAEEPITCEMIEKWSADRVYFDPLKRRIVRIAGYAKSPEIFIRKLMGKS